MDIFDHPSLIQVKDKLMKLIFLFNIKIHIRKLLIKILLLLLYHIKKYVIYYLPIMVKVPIKSILLIFSINEPFSFGILKKIINKIKQRIPIGTLT